MRSPFVFDGGQIHAYCSGVETVSVPSSPASAAEAAQFVRNQMPAEVRWFFSSHAAQADGFLKSRASVSMPLPTVFAFVVVVFFFVVPVPPVFDLGMIAMGLTGP